MKTENIHQNYIQAKKYYEDNPGDYAYKHLFYAILPYLKKAAQETNLAHFSKTMVQMEKHGFTARAKFANQMVWTFISLFSNMRTAKNISNPEFQAVFKFLRILQNQKPSHEHSILLKFFLKRADYYNCFAEFVSWWDVKNLRPDDYQPEVWKEIKYPALAETLYSARAKNILIRCNNSTSNECENLKIEAQEIIRELRRLADVYPHFKFLPYYAAKIQFNIFGHEGVKELFMPFSRQNATQFWVWDFLADIFRSDIKTYVALLCRAMLCRADAAMRINIHAKLMDAFIKMEMFDQAHTELDTVVKIRNDNGWKIPNRLIELQHETWYFTSKPELKQRLIYKELARPSDEILFGESAKTVALITGYAQQANKVWYLSEDLETGSFLSNKAQLHKPKVGMLIQLFMHKQRILKAKPLNEELHKGLVERVSGELKIFNANSFGLLNGVFIHSQFIIKHKLKNKQYLELIALRSYNKKKSIWGWKAVEVIV